MVIQKGLLETASYYINRKQRSKEKLDIIRNYHLFQEQQGINEDELIYTPLISVITPLYNTKDVYLRELIDSVRTQVYENWQLCFADGSDAEHSYVEKICKEYGDERIKYYRLECNQGIVGNTNKCVSLAEGEYYALLDHDDLLHPMALYECVKAINSGADFIYTDEMKFVGRIEDSVDIVCKNDFCKHELRSHNYICHLVVFKAQLLHKLDEFYRAKCEGSQDYDMVLRLTEKAEKIVHIPKILYYWRVHEGSVSMDLSVKKYAVDAAKIAIAEHLVRCGENASVECNYPYETIYRLKYEVNDFPKVSIIWDGNITKKKQKKFLSKIIEDTEYSSFEIICRGNEAKNIVDSNVTIKVVENQNLHRYMWADKMSGIASGEILLFMDSSWIPQNKEWLKELVIYAMRADVGAVGPFAQDWCRRVVSGGIMLDLREKGDIVLLNTGMDSADQGYEANMKHVREAAAIPGFCLMVSKDKYKKTGGFDSTMGSVADIDFCLRLKKEGLKNIWTPFSLILTNRKMEYEIKEYNELINKWENSLKSLDNMQGVECHPLLKTLNYI